MSETVDVNPVPNPEYLLKDSLDAAKRSLRDVPEWAGGTGESLRERDQAIVLLREWVHYKMRLPEITARTHKFLEGLNDQP